MSAHFAAVNSAAWKVGRLPSKREVPRGSSPTAGCTTSGRCAGPNIAARSQAPDRGSWKSSSSTMDSNPCKSGAVFHHVNLAASNYGFAIMKRTDGPMASYGYLNRFTRHLETDSMARALNTGPSSASRHIRRGQKGYIRMKPENAHVRSSSFCGINGGVKSSRFEQLVSNRYLGHTKF